MGTSHQEPMVRGTPNEWRIFGSGIWDYSTNSQNIYDFWVNGTIRAKPFESIYTMGMRGAGDCEYPRFIAWFLVLTGLLVPLSEETNVALLEKIVTDQRQILTNVYNGTNVTTIPQMWALCMFLQYPTMSVH